MLKNRKLIKFALLVSLIPLTFGFQTKNAFAATTPTSKTNYSFKEIEKIYSSQSSQAEKIAFIKSRLKSNSSTVSSTTINEFDLYKAADKNKGLSPNQKGSLVGEYIKKIKELSTKDNSTLANMGLSQTRIQAIKNASNVLSNNINANSVSEANINSLQNSMLSLSGATCTLQKTLDGYYYDKSYLGSSFKTLIFVGTAWQWNQAPLVGATDSFSNAWASSTNLQLYKTTDGIDYCDEDTNNITEQPNYSNEAFNNRPGGLNGETFSFDAVSMYGSNGQNLLYEYARFGYSMNTLVSTDFHVGSFTYDSEYDHAVLPVSPSISITSTGSISLGFAYKEATTPTRQVYFIQKSDFVEW